MMQAAEKEIVSRTEYDKNGRIYYSLPNDDALAWTIKTNKERKVLLDPLATEVDLTGKVLYDELDSRMFSSRTVRGWGRFRSIIKMAGEVVSCG